MCARCSGMPGRGHSGPTLRGVGGMLLAGRAAILVPDASNSTSRSSRASSNRGTGVTGRHRTGQEITAQHNAAPVDQAYQLTLACPNNNTSLCIVAEVIVALGPLV
jgi:hypothetical protein